VAACDPERSRRFDNDHGSRERAPFERPVGQVQRHVIEAFLDRHVAAGARVLDAGSGPGRFAMFLAKRGCRLTLVDASETMLQEPRSGSRPTGWRLRPSRITA
jgi:2-polyprenyl-3-methyl-5-hydroxy-6-metoxy-1,4-benzoquinol methylase